MIFMLGWGYVQGTDVMLFMLKRLNWKPSKCYIGDGVRSNTPKKQRRNKKVHINLQYLGATK